MRRYLINHGRKFSANWKSFFNQFPCGLWVTFLHVGNDMVSIGELYAITTRQYVPKYTCIDIYLMIHTTIKSLPMCACLIINKASSLYSKNPAFNSFNSRHFTKVFKVTVIYCHVPSSGCLIQL